MLFAYHLVYLSLTIAIMVIVANSLARNGRVFLISVFGAVETADAINRLLVVGFCVTKIGYAALAIRWGGAPENIMQAAEMMSFRIGVILLAMGCMHCMNLILLCLWQRHLNQSKKRSA